MQNKFELQLKQNAYKAIFKGETREGPAQEAAEAAKEPSLQGDRNRGHRAPRLCRSESSAEYLGFSERLLCDFISQALLRIMAGSLYKELKDKYGIRDVVSFKEVTTVNAERIQDISTNPQMLANLFYIVQNDTNIAERLKNIDGCIKACEKQERVHLREAAN